MSQIVTVLLQIITFLVQNKDAIKQLILDLEALLPNSNGNDKAAQVRTFVGTSLGIEAQIEAVWPLVSPIFNAFVASVKKPA